MKRTIASLVIFASIFVLGMALNLQAEEDRKCTNATLRGPYVAINHGTIFDARGLTAGLGVWTFDGNGNSVFTGTFADQTGISHVDSLQLTYTVNPDCTGIGGGGQIFEFVISDGGNAVDVLITRPDRVVTWEVKKQFPRHHHDEEDLED